MLITKIITVKLESGECDIFLSPALFQSEKLPDFKSGKLEMLYFYGNLRDENYLRLLDKEVLDEKFKSDRYLVSCGQDFETYYLGSLHTDFERKSCWGWEGKLSEQDVKILSESLFDPETPSKQVTMFAPTPPSVFHFALVKGKKDNP